MGSSLRILPAADETEEFPRLLCRLASFDVSDHQGTILTRARTPSLFSVCAGSIAIAGGVMLGPSCQRDPDSLPAPSPTPVGVVRLELGAPAEMALDTEVQLTATAIKSDGTTEDITSSAAWNTSNPSIIGITPAGLATAFRRGEAQIIARYAQRSVSAPVLVLPAGTYRLAGRVTEHGIGVRDAVVSVVAGVGEGLLARTGAPGDFTLYGVSGPVRLEVRRDGYLDVIQELVISGHTTHDFELVAARPVPSLAGLYTLTVTAGCRGGSGTLPDAARERSYRAAVDQDQRRLSVALSGADFLLANGRGDHFSGFVDATERVTFEIAGVGTDYYGRSRCFDFGCDLVERLTPTTALVIGGSVAAERQTSDLAGTLFGAFWISEGTTPPLDRFSSYCTGVHGFAMRRK